ATASETGVGVEVKRTLPVGSATVYEAMTWVGSLTAAWIFAETATCPPGLVNGGLVVTPATRIDSGRSVSWPGVLRVISGAPFAVAETLKFAGTTVVPDSVRVRVTALFPGPIDWPGWRVTDVLLNTAETPAGSPETARL